MPFSRGHIENEAKVAIPQNFNELFCLLMTSIDITLIKVYPVIRIHGERTKHMFVEYILQLQIPSYLQNTGRTNTTHQYGRNIDYDACADFTLRIKFHQSEEIYFQLCSSVYKISCTAAKWLEDGGVYKLLLNVA